jgi:hypothetical protein
VVRRKGGQGGGRGPRLYRLGGCNATQLLRVGDSSQPAQTAGASARRMAAAPLDPLTAAVRQCACVGGCERAAREGEERGYWAFKSSRPRPLSLCCCLLEPRKSCKKMSPHAALLPASERRNWPCLLASGRQRSPALDDSSRNMLYQMARLPLAIASSAVTPPSEDLVASHCHPPVRCLDPAILHRTDKPVPAGQRQRQ